MLIIGLLFLSLIVGTKAINFLAPDAIQAQSEAHNTAAADPREGRCPVNWLTWQDNCYYFGTAEYGSWDYNEDICKELAGQEFSGHLVSIHSQEENQFIYDNRYYDWFFIGLRSNGTHSPQWSDGTPLDYTNWAPGEPPIFSYCVEMFPAPQWSSASCCCQSMVCKTKMIYTTWIPSSTPTTPTPSTAAPIISTASTDEPTPSTTSTDAPTPSTISTTIAPTPTTTPTDPSTPTTTSPDAPTQSTTSTTNAPTHSPTPTTNAPSDECSNYIGTWRSTDGNSQALFVISSQEVVEDFIHIQGLYRNMSSGAYYPLDGWTGINNPSIVILQVLFTDSMAGIAFSGKCNPNHCDFSGTSLHLMATTSVVDISDYECADALTWSFMDTFLKDPEILHAVREENVPYPDELAVTAFPSECGDYVGTWRSTIFGSEALIVILSQETVEAFFHFEGLYRNRSSGGYFPLDGWTGTNYPCSLVMQVLFKDSLTGIGFAGKCLPSSCEGTNIVLQLATATSQIAEGASVCEEAVSDTSVESFVKDLDVMSICEDTEALNYESVQIFCM